MLPDARASASAYFSVSLELDPSLRQRAGKKASTAEKRVFRRERDE
jgi:hypothetical protein